MELDFVRIAMYVLNFALLACLVAAVVVLFVLFARKRKGIKQGNKSQ